MRSLVFLFFFSIVLTPIFVAHAQWGDSLTISLTPENPKPGEQVSLSLSGASTNLGSDDISWSVDGNKINEALGLQQITIAYPGVGKTISVKADVVAFDGSTQTQTITLGGALVTLLWESRTFTPPFFDGRSKHSNGATVVVQAIPNFKDSGGNIISPVSLVYNWKKDGTVLQDVSGTGRDSYTFTDDGIDSSTQISVDVSITTSRSLPDILFYRYSLLFGTDMSLQTNDFSGQGEIGVRAVPLYSPVDSIYRFAFPVLSWNLSGQNVDNKNLPYLIIQSGNSQNSSGDLSVSIKNPNYFGEDIPKSATLTFK
jgi:hypothetical protein